MGGEASYCCCYEVADSESNHLAGSEAGLDVAAFLLQYRTSCRHFQRREFGVVQKHYTHLLAVLRKKPSDADVEAAAEVEAEVEAELVY